MEVTKIVFLSISYLHTFTLSKLNYFILLLYQNNLSSSLPFCRDHVSLTNVDVKAVSLLKDALMASVEIN